MTAPETDTSELKPCPHCGKPAMWLHKSQGGYAIICGGTPRCRAAVGLHGGGTSFTEVEALTAWNTRVAVDDLTLDELRGRAIRALREAGWRANDKLSLHSVIETMIAFGINIIRDKPASCGWPDCGCDADAVCNAALVPAPAATTLEAPNIEDEFFYDPRTGRVAGTTLEADHGYPGDPVGPDDEEIGMSEHRDTLEADGLVERLTTAAKMFYDGKPGQERQWMVTTNRALLFDAAAAITQLRRELQHAINAGVTLLERAEAAEQRLATVERERDSAALWLASKTRLASKLSTALEQAKPAAALSPGKGTQGRVVQPKNVAELDALLNSEGDQPITINPDGSISPDKGA